MSAVTIFAIFVAPISDADYLAVTAACLHGQTVLCVGRDPFAKC